MKFLLNDPKFGDMIRVKIDDFYHYGIFVDDNTVVQFGKPPVNGFARQADVRVCTTDLAEFSCGGFVEVAKPEKSERKTRRKPKAVVEFAMHRIGEKGYHILHNNCEHFAYECAYGRKYSHQTDEVRTHQPSTPVCDIYLRRFPFACVDEKIYPKLRVKEISACRSEKVREEKFYAWKLLQEALWRSFRLEIKECKPYKDGGKWFCKDAYFSISHSGEFACVAVSNQPIGVDFEKIDEARFEELPSHKICTEKELALLPKENSAREINRLWTVKESAFKLENGVAFLPNTIETDSVLHCSKTFQVDGEEYFLSATGLGVESLKIIADGDIKEVK